MAKITTITNPLTGQPVQVDQLDHTAQQIDDGLNIARNVSNPNLLDNWYFGNPVDQRGGYVVPPGVPYTGASSGTTTKYYTVKSIFTYDDIKYAGFDVDGSQCNVPFYTCVRGYTGEGYGIDRFKIYSGVTGNLIVKDGCIEVSLTGLYSSLMQVFEKGAIVEGTYTLSVLTTPGLYKWTFEASKTTPATAPIGWFGIPNAYSYFNYNADGTSNLYLFDNASSETISVSAIAVKLELGDTQTLAHQDANGDWVLNEIPNYGEQLARCQRYFQLYSSADIRPAKAVDCRPTMRADPAQGTVVVNGTTYYYNNADL